MTSLPGDKIKVKHSDHAGKRGTLVGIKGKYHVVRLDEGGEFLQLREEDLTNLSLAARKAWKSEPSRRVGRRKGSKLTDRVSVTLRIDRDVWESFRSKEESGLIKDRSKTMNSWLREKLDALDKGTRDIDAEEGE